MSTSLKAINGLFPMNRKYSFSVNSSLLLIFFAFSSYYSQPYKPKNSRTSIDVPNLLILGNVQDAGSPHMGCDKLCCKDLFENPDKTRMVVSIGISDPITNMCWMIEATPDFPRQAKILKEHCSGYQKEYPNGIFLTHAHIGHYSGLMYLGKESMNSSDVPIYAMTRMKGFLIQNGPWSQLVHTNNIKISNIDHDQILKLSENISIKPFLVPHRDEFSETVGYKIIGPNKSALFIPDIDKWSKWNLNLAEELIKVDYAFIDGTFFDNKEINNRSISEIPHPFVIETMELFRNHPLNVKNKIHFIHLNHTNPLLDSNSLQTKEVISEGFNIARQYQIFKL